MRIGLIAVALTLLLSGCICNLAAPKNPPSNPGANANDTNGNLDADMPPPPPDDFGNIVADAAGGDASGDAPPPPPE